MSCVRYPVALFLAVLPAHHATAQEGEGFLGYAWGTPREVINRALDLVPSGGDGRRVQYATGVPALDGIPVTMCDVEFVDERFAGVIIMVRDTADARRLLRFLMRRYGLASGDAPLGWQWLTPETHVSFDEGMDGTGYLYVYALRFAGTEQDVEKPFRKKGE